MNAEPALGSPPLIDEQVAVVRQPAEAKLLVTAGAGAGKTHTLVHRIEALVSTGGLAPGDVLVLTFSRAAVRELRERLSTLGGRSRHVRVTTFDSWALEMLKEVSADVDWNSSSFDERIRKAADLVTDAETAPEWLEELRHVLIDEVQDLVGDRRELVEVLLDSYDCGFTVVGDPAQAIYSFQVSDPKERAIENNRFFDWLRRTFVDDLTELSLAHNHRARTAEAREALRFEREVRACDSGPEAQRIHEELRTDLATRMDFGDITVPFIRESLLDTATTTAVLCRTNGEALLISEWLHDAGIPHQVRRTAQDRAVPAWLSDLLNVEPGVLALTRPHFGRLLSLPLSQGEDTDQERIWRLLLSCAADRSGRSVELARLRDALASGRLPDALTAQSAHPLTVSTFHRAKGLEFERVLVVDPGPLETAENAPGVDAADRVRALYVAMTRPRSELYRLELPPKARPDNNGFRLVRKDKQTGRWARFGYRHWERRGLELLSGDLRAGPLADAQQVAEDVTALQTYLRSVPAPGDPVDLVRLDQVTEDHDQRLAPGYALRHSGRTIGVVSEAFRKDLYRHMQQSHTFQPWNWPRRITDLRLDTVETVAGERTGGNGSGVWLVPRPTGLGRFHYDSADKD